MADTVSPPHAERPPRRREHGLRPLARASGRVHGRSGREPGDPSTPGADTAAVTVLVTGGENVSVLATLRALRAAGHVPWATVHGPRTFAARSRAACGTVRVPEPGRDPRRFVQAVARAVDRIGAAVLIPGTEIAALAIAEHRDALPAGVVIGCGSKDALQAVTDKMTVDRLARAAGLGVPPSQLVRRGSIPSSVAFPLPVVVKPTRSEQRDGQGSARHVGAVLARTMAEVRSAVDRLPEGIALVQPLLEGRFVSLSGIFWDGELVCAIQSTVDRLWPVPCGSISAARTVALDPWLAAAVADLLRPSGWRGLFQADLFDQDGSYVIIDLNPRVYRSLAHATRAGVNLPAIWVDLLLGREPTAPTSYREGVRYRNEEGDIRALADLVRRGHWRPAIIEAFPRRDTAYAVFAADDPLPTMTTVERAIRFVRRRIRLPR